MCVIAPRLTGLTRTRRTLLRVECVLPVAVGTRSRFSAFAIAIWERPLRVSFEDADDDARLLRLDLQVADLLAVH